MRLIPIMNRDPYYMHEWVDEELNPPELEWYSNIRKQVNEKLGYDNQDVWPMHVFDARVLVSRVTRVNWFTKHGNTIELL